MRNGNRLTAEAIGRTQRSCVKPDIAKICKHAKRCLSFVVKNHISIKNLHVCSYVIIVILSKLINALR